MFSLEQKVREEKERYLNYVDANKDVICLDMVQGNKHYKLQIFC